MLMDEPVYAPEDLLGEETPFEIVPEACMSHCQDALRLPCKLVCRQRQH
jgi:hypothetical protein